MHIGWPEIVLAAVIFVLLFGAKRIPDIARSVGKALREFRKGVKDVTDDLEDPKDDDGEA